MAITTNSCNIGNSNFAAPAWSIVEAPDASLACQSYNGEATKFKLAPFTATYDELCDESKWLICWSTLDTSFEETISEVFTSCGKQRLVRKDEMTITVTTPCVPCIENGVSNLIGQIKDSRDAGSVMRAAIELADGNQYIGSAYITDWTIGGTEEEGDLSYGWTATIECPQEIRCGTSLPTLVGVFPTASAGATVEFSQLSINSGGTDLMDFGTVTANTASGTASVNLRDDDFTTSWNGGDVANDPYVYLQLDCATPQIEELVICAGDDETLAPTALEVKLSSDGGTTWTTVATLTPGAWTANTCQTLTVADYDSASPALSGTTTVGNTYSDGLDVTLLETITVTSGPVNWITMTNQGDSEIYFSWTDAEAGNERIRLEPSGTAPGADSWTGFFDGGNSYSTLYFYRPVANGNSISPDIKFVAQLRTV